MISCGDSEPNSQADVRPGGGSSDKGASAFTGSRPEISAQSCLWTTLSYSSQWRVATLGLECGHRSRRSPQSGSQNGDWNWPVALEAAVREERCRGTGRAVAFSSSFFSETPFISTSQLCDDTVTIYYQGAIKTKK